MCCENATHGIPPNPLAWSQNQACKPILGAATSMGLTIPQLENCCTMDIRSGGCEVTLPPSHPSCVKCFSNQSAGFPTPRFGKGVIKLGASAPKSFKRSATGWGTSCDARRIIL